MKEFSKELGKILLEHLRHTASSRFKLTVFFGFLGFILALNSKLTTEFVALAGTLTTFYNIAKSYTDVKNGKNSI